MKGLPSGDRVRSWLRPKRVLGGDQRRLYRDRIDALRHPPFTDDTYYDYLFLLGELNDTDLVAELRGTFRREWLSLMRRDLARLLEERRFDAARRRAADMRWEWQEGVAAGAADAILGLIAGLENPLSTPAPKTLHEVAGGFRVVGLEATDAIVGWLTSSNADMERVAQQLFSRDGVGGRYLVRRWAECDPRVEAWLRTYEPLAAPGLPVAGGPCAIWPRERSESPVARMGAARLALDYNPFGPEKAEQDPLLPDLFYRLWPVWQEATTPQPSVLVAPPGCGRSALMWMMRYESELVGSALDRILPVYVPLHAPLAPRHLARLLQRAAYDTVLCVIARQPDALLGLDEAGQWRLGTFLLQVAGGLSPLLSDLERVGLRVGDLDTGLVYETLDRIRQRRELWATGGDETGGDYEIAAVRRLLRDAFTARELVAFCQDRPAFRPVLADFGPRFSFADMIDAVVNYAMRRDRIGGLLEEIEAFNPRQFARYRTSLTSGITMDQAGFPRPHGCDYLFLVIDVSFEEEGDIGALLQCLFERWLNLLAPQHVVPKVFVSRCPACPVTPVKIEWSREALYELLRHRLERAGLVSVAGQPLLGEWVDGIEHAGWALVDAAEGSPGRLIRLGNQLLSRLGRSAPITRDEFSQLLTTANDS